MKNRFNDLMDDWREYTDMAGSLWNFAARDPTGHGPVDYPGTFIPQVAQRLIQRYTKHGDLVLDMFIGSGTTAVECIKTGRVCLGVDLQDRVEPVMAKIPELFENQVYIHIGDSADPRINLELKAITGELWGRERVDFAILHPPYWKAIDYDGGDLDLSHAVDIRAFTNRMREVVYNAWKLLEPGRFIAVVIGDYFEKGQVVPLGFRVMQVLLEQGLQLKAIYIKNVANNETKGKDGNLWRYRALQFGFAVFEHEYIIVARKGK